MLKQAQILTDDPTKLQEMVVLRDQEIDLLREQVRLLKAKLFAPKSEKWDVAERSLQGVLFEVEDEPEIEPEDDEKETVIVRRRKKRGRKALPEHLPREIIVHDLEPQEKICACGSEMKQFGEEATEELDYQPAVLKVLRHVRYKYACGVCQGVGSDEGAVKIAPAPARMIPQSIAAPGLLAQVITAKFADGLPFYRVERQFKRLGLDLKRATMCNWAYKVAQRMEPLWDMLLKRAKAHSWLQMDETTVQVMGEQGRPNRTKSFMWVIRGGPPDTPIVYYAYHPTRSASVPKKLLEDYQGIVQTDGYEGYGFLDKQSGVCHAGCWEHARRKFLEAIKGHVKRKRAKKLHAEIALEKIGRLYRIEREAKRLALTSDQLLALRKERAEPLVHELHAWLVDLSLKAAPKSLLGKAVAYTLAQWSRLRAYLENGDIPMDTNLVENGIRPFVLGRKAWLFSGHPNGAKASAIIYSMVETAKANGWEPHAWLTHVFNRLPSAQTDEDLSALLPTVPPTT